MSYKTSYQEYKIMLGFMQEHGDLCAPVGGATKRAQLTDFWPELTRRLNEATIGYTKTSTQWKKVWCDWKSRVKKKVLSLSDDNSKASLTDLEVQLATFLGLDGAIPSHDKVPNSDETQPDLVKQEPETAGDVKNDNLSSELDNQSIDKTQTTQTTDNKYEVVCPSSDNALVDSTDSDGAVRKSTQDRRKRKDHSRRNNDTLDVLERIFDKFSRSEQRRLEVELLKQRTEARRQKISLKRQQRDHMEISDFVGNLKNTYKAFSYFFNWDKLKK